MSTALGTASSGGSGPIAPGHVLGRYELLMPIAAGGMAMVWAARLKGTRGFQKIVAVKTMLPKLSEDVQFEQMFLDEASLASQVRHPQVVEILDLGEQDGVLFLVMEWIDGVPLNQLMKAAKASGGMPVPVAIRIVMQVLAGLHAAHELRDQSGTLVGLVHRDVSPQNVLVTYDGVTKVVDFGVAKATALGGGATGQGQIKGKVGYMAPEQIEGEPIDRRADLFATGIVLYALTTGKHPFRRESDAATMYNICSSDPVIAPSRFIPDFPAPLENVLLKALAKAPADRYQTANEMLRDLDQALPPEERANTDEHVAQFVRKMVGDRLDERRGTLHSALARADEFAQSAVARVGGSLPSTAGVPSLLLPGSDNTANISAPEKVNHWLRWMAVGALIAAGIGVILVFLAGSREGSPGSEPAMPPAPQATVQEPKPEPRPVSPAPSLSHTSQMTTPDTAQEAVGPWNPPVEQPSRPRAPRTNNPPPAPKDQRSWMHDPGF